MGISGQRLNLVSSEALSGLRIAPYSCSKRGAAPRPASYRQYGIGGSPPPLSSARSLAHARPALPRPRVPAGARLILTATHCGGESPKEEKEIRVSVVEWGETATLGAACCASAHVGRSRYSRRRSPQEMGRRSGPPSAAQ